jgi:hypothetical protein
MENTMNEMKTGTCISLSGNSTLSYRISLKDDKEVCIALTGNSGKGIFNKQPIALEQIYSLLASEKKPITSGSLLGLFEGKSSNSAGFFLATILAEGLLKTSSDNQRQYELIDKKEFKKVIKGYTPKKTGKKRNND